jgi:hypothetical protein
VSTAEPARPGDSVESVGYLAWVAFERPGVLIVGDTVLVDGRELGEVCGFDETHAPNHYNIVIKTDELLTGRTARLSPETRVTFVGQSRESLGW